MEVRRVRVEMSWRATDSGEVRRSWDKASRRESNSACIAGEKLAIATSINEKTRKRANTCEGKRIRGQSYR